MEKSKAKKEEKVLNKTLIFFIRVLKEEGFISTWLEGAKIYFAIEGEEITPNKLSSRARSSLASDGVETILFFEYFSLKPKLKKLLEVKQEKEEVKEEIETVETKFRFLKNDATAVTFSIKFEDLEPVFGVDLENDKIDTIRYKINQKINDDKFLLEYVGLDPFVNTVESRKFGSWTTVVKEKDAMGIEQARLIANQKLEIVIKRVKNSVATPTREDLENFLDKYLKERGITPFDLFENNYRKHNNSEEKMLDEDLVMVCPGIELHLGKLATLADHEDFSTKHALWRLIKVAKEIVKFQEMVKAKTLVMGIGNDSYNSDTIEGSTSSGTPQDNDSRYKESYISGKVGTMSLLETIKILFNKVILQLQMGNHDEKTIFSMFTHFHDLYRLTKDSIVEVPFTYQDARYTTCREFGKNLFIFSHGNAPKGKFLSDKVMAEAAEQQFPEEYRRAKQVYIFAGHVHTDSENNFLNGKVTVLRHASLSGTDAWHANNLYIGQRQGHSVYVFHKDTGYKYQCRITLSEEDKQKKIPSPKRSAKTDINESIERALNLNQERVNKELFEEKIREINEFLKVQYADFNDRLEEILVILGIKNITEEQVKSIINIMGYEEKTKPAQLELKYIEKATAK